MLFGWLHVLLLLLSFVLLQLLPTLDIYTWTEEHVVSSLVLFLASDDFYFHATW